MNPITNNHLFNIVVVDFFDNIDNDNGQKFTQKLQGLKAINPVCYNNPFSKSFSNNEANNILELLDKGQAIIKETNADVLIWGYRKNNNIHIYFQSKHLYEQQMQSFVSLADSLCLPLDFFSSDNNCSTSKSLLWLVYGAIISSINHQDNEILLLKSQLLTKVESQLSKIDFAQEFNTSYQSYIMNFLGIIYLSLNNNNLNKDNFNLIKDFFNTALSYKDAINNSIQLGCIYYHLGQIHQQKADASLAIYNLKAAQRYLSKHNYPYDYGYISYKISIAYIEQWKQNQSTQILREAIFNLREAEKIYTQIQSPQFWGTIQNLIGQMLHNLGRIAQNTQICNLAIDAYKNHQKIAAKEQNHLLWASIEERIGELHYLQAKISKSTNEANQSVLCYTQSLKIYEKHHQKHKVIKLKANLAKSYELLEDIKPDETNCKK